VTLALRGLAQIADARKPLLYNHIYSYSSVKSVVHWFQIIRWESSVAFAWCNCSALTESLSRVARVCAPLQRRNLPDVRRCTVPPPCPAAV